MTDSPHCAITPSQIIRFGLAQLKQSSTYDLLMRLPMLAWSSALALISAVGLYRYVRDADPALPSAVYSASSSSVEPKPARRSKCATRERSVSKGMVSVASRLLEPI